MIARGDGPASALASGRSFGLYPASAFRLADRASAGASPGRWYFRDETIAIPIVPDSVASYAHGVRAYDDVLRWAGTVDVDRPPALPPLVWVAAPDLATGARVDANATSIRFGSGAARPLALVPKHPLNRSYFDRSSAEFFAARTLKVRGRADGAQFIARTLWPEDFALERNPRFAPLANGAALPAALRALFREAPQGGARAPFETRTLWRRDAGGNAPTLAPGRAVLAIMLNGAQGDDDEAHGGHFALVTGRIEEDGAIGDWLASNFYPLDFESEKGIIAAPVPLDNYLADLNAGQAYYRPSYLLAMTLRSDRAAGLLQGGLNRFYQQFYRHQLVFEHSTMNCTGISVDALRAVGGDAPPRAPAAPVLAALAFPWLVASKRSLAKGRSLYDYLSTDQTRLMPGAAFEEVGARMLALAKAGPSPDAGATRGRLAQLVAEDAESVVWIRIPQIPSSRAFGDAPVDSPAEYRTRLPPEPQIVPVPPRPFPQAMRDADLLPRPRRPSDYALVAWTAIVIAALAWCVIRLW